MSTEPPNPSAPEKVAADPTEAASPAAREHLHPAVRGIGTVSAAAAGLAVVAMFVIMLVEAGSRYLLNAPLGWNVSAVERLLMPGMVFLALPWMYVCAGHVSAGMLYSRLSAGWQRCARIIAFLCVLVGAALLFASGLNGAVQAAILGDAPPPGSAEVPIPTWSWLALQPLGGLGLLLVALIDAPRFLRDGEIEDAAEGHQP
jgi:TRAP-type C4-dicarboxylate transport system permease small subunit